MMLRRMIALCGVMLISATTPLAYGSEPTDEAAAMEAWQKAATPGEVHAFLAKKSGKWKITGKMWMAPGTDPVVSESTAVAEMILGGRFLKEEMKGTSMGMPFEGLGITGYDNTTGIVTSVWYDNMGTVTSMFTGKYETPGEPLELTGHIPPDTTIRQGCSELLLYLDLGIYPPPS